MRLHPDSTRKERAPSFGSPNFFGSFKNYHIDVVGKGHTGIATAVGAAAAGSVVVVGSFAQAG